MTFEDRKGEFGRNGSQRITLRDPQVILSGCNDPACSRVGCCRSDQASLAKENTKKLRRDVRKALIGNAASQTFDLDGLMEIVGINF